MVIATLVFYLLALAILAIQLHLYEILQYNVNHTKDGLARIAMYKMHRLRTAVCYLHQARLRWRCSSFL